jgi:hypothetical protein
MTLQIEETLADLAIGDYFLGTDGETIWKVVRKRPDGYIGITNKAGDKVIVKPQDADTRVQQMIFGVDTLEEAQAAAEKKIADTLGGKVIARKIEPGDWVMPSLDEIYSDVIQLKAHLAVHHNHTAAADLGSGDLAVVHHGLHTDGESDHTHEEK